jgi:hypothetical protein
VKCLYTVFASIFFMLMAILPFRHDMPLHTRTARRPRGPEEESKMLLPQGNLSWCMSAPPGAVRSRSRRLRYHWDTETDLASWPAAKVVSLSPAARGMWRPNWRVQHFPKSTSDEFEIEQIPNLHVALTGVANWLVIGSKLVSCLWLRGESIPHALIL